MARRKAGETAGADGGAGLSSNEAVMGQMASLQHSMAQLQQGVVQLVETTATHTELLRAVLAATTAETGPEETLADLLEQIVGRLGDQASLLRGIGVSMARLPADVGAEVGERMASALADVR